MALPIPRPAALIEGLQAFKAGRRSQQELDALYDSAITDTIQRFEATGSPVITDGAGQTELCNLFD
jgi:5-methyltetrahydropteroyltriglutamate--homocysteine methyltransferase